MSIDAVKHLSIPKVNDSKTKKSQTLKWKYAVEKLDYRY